MKKYVIAIDGPAASGKSTTAKSLAKKLKYIYIDSGAMYRACGLMSLQEKVDLSDEIALAEMLNKITIDIHYNENGNRIILNGEDVSERIREADITKLSSQIAIIGNVRTKMVELQRIMGQDGGVIMDGRDIGTVVFPDADFKFFMIADVHTRAVRRWEEAKSKGEELSLEAIEKELIWRDKNDSTRKISPLKQAEDAIPIDTSNMTIPQQVDFLYEIILRGKNA
ncbi:MAG: (d)CMP kinase [Candidatus Cloacimonetes bacterium]|nr:(d)CMP kinase [Candidatus Cloacimonadota bacterium]MCF7814428.1 (d)CMP kinase [Candidatus Cloacimonadota bacterium]MCF7869010.1 (d)CMP kinase [Candidatus Cloacimonadota bacterium]MCF7884412.1 (d)CMP kinase [Candidatus Cloacimonadota bacterium]